MQLTFKFLLLAVALASGSTAIVSALPVGASSLETRGVEYGDITFLAREIPNLHDRANHPDLFVSLFLTITCSNCLTKCSFGLPKPRNPGYAADQHFRNNVGRKGMARALNDPNHPHHHVALQMQREANRRRPSYAASENFRNSVGHKGMARALGNPNHPFHHVAKQMQQEKENREAFSALPFGS